MNVLKASESCIPYVHIYCNSSSQDSRSCGKLHNEVCLLYPVKCPKGCSAKLARRDVTSHIANSCPTIPRLCPFSIVGCTEMFTGSWQLEMHLRDKSAFSTHLSLVEESQKSLKKQLQEKEKRTRENYQIVSFNKMAKCQENKMPELEPNNPQPCPFSTVGCKNMIAGSRMKSHLTDKSILSAHLSLVKTSQESLRNQLRKRGLIIATLREEVKRKDRQIASLREEARCRGTEFWELAVEYALKVKYKDKEISNLKSEIRELTRKVKEKDEQITKLKRDTTHATARVDPSSKYGGSRTLVAKDGSSKDSSKDGGVKDSSKDGGLENDSEKLMHAGVLPDNHTYGKWSTLVALFRRR